MLEVENNVTNNISHKFVLGLLYTSKF